MTYKYFLIFNPFKLSTFFLVFALSIMGRHCYCSILCAILVWALGHDPNWYQFYPGLCCGPVCIGTSIFYGPIILSWAMFLAQ